jgi:hypothetical protein
MPNHLHAQAEARADDAVLAQTQAEARAQAAEQRLREIEAQLRRLEGSS